ncbi:MAG: endonuclease MutS2 [bacterium]
MLEALEQLELNRVLESCAKEASSGLGRERILRSQPMTDISAIRKELEQVDEMSLLLGRTSLPISGISDITPSLQQLRPIGGLLEREEYFPLKDVLAASGRLKKFFTQQEEGATLLKTLAANLGNFEELIREFDRIFDPHGEIKDSASPELRRLRRQMETELRHLQSSLEAILKLWSRQNWTQEDALTWREGRLLIPLKCEHRGKIKGVVQDESATGATVFVEPLEAIEIGNAIRRLENEERREIQRLLLELCDQIRSRLPEITILLEILAELDHIYARARFARRLQCVPPMMTEEPYLRLVETRHTILVLKGGEVVPLSLTLGGDEGRILIITGPNAGGKTVAMKTVGLCCLMAACGLHIPAKEGTTLPVLASLHCDIGDPQSLEQDLSTFTSHLQRLKSALANPQLPKLVLLDEIGAGTDPAEGSAIARAALLELRRQGALVIATTHQGTLKVFAHETEGVFNGSMEFDQQSLQPTFRFHAGLPGSSYALEISARVGLAPEIIAVARQFLGEQSSRLEELLSQLNESLRLSEEARRSAEVKLVEQEALRQLYQQRLQELTAGEKERLLQAARQAKEILDSANRMIEAAVKEIREKGAAKEVIKRAHQQLQEEKEKVEALLQASEPATQTPVEKSTIALAVGDWVCLEGLKDPVQVVALRQEGGEAKLAVGGVHLWMDTAKLTPVAPPDPSRAVPEVRISVSELSPQSRSFELDLRGMTGDEAVTALEKYLTDCEISGWKSVRIIHGKGTGVLRTRVRAFLEDYPGVKSFRYGRPEEGEFGVTIVELE